jgi:hypothetical protein
MSIVIKIKNYKSTHFWHQIMGEFMPVVAIIAKEKPQKVYLVNPKRSWRAPFDKFYLELGVEIIFLNKIGNLSKLPTFTYKSWEYGWDQDGYRKCMLAVDYLKGLIESDTPKEENKILVQYRDSNKELEEYFHKNFSGIKKTYGTNRRFFKDMKNIHTIVPDTEYIYADNEPLLSQIKPYLNRSKLIIEHGAGMFFVLFMEEKSKIMEILTPEKFKTKKTADQSLRRICKNRNNVLERVVVPNKGSIMLKKEEIIRKSKIFY